MTRHEPVAPTSVEHHQGVLAMLARFLRDEDGVELVEFALVLALLSIAGIAAMVWFGTDASEHVTARQTNLTNRSVNPY